MMLRKKILEKLKVRQAEDWSADDSHYESGLELARQGRHAEAVSEFKQALQTEDDPAKTYLAMGVAYENLGRHEEAIQAFTEATKANPNFTEAYTKLGLAFDRSGQFLKAIRMHLNAIRLAPGDVELRKNLGLAYFNVGSYAEAIKAFTQALQIDPEDAAVHHCLGLVYLDLEDIDAALEQQKLIKELGRADLATSLMSEIDRQVLRTTAQAAARRYAKTDPQEYAQPEPEADEGAIVRF